MSGPAQGNLSLAALASIERAALSLIEAVRAAQGTSSAQASLSPSLAATRAVTVTELCNEFLTAKARAGRSDSYLRCLVGQLRAFCERFGNRVAGGVTSAEIESWVYGNEWKPVSQRGYLLTVRTLYNFALARAYLAGNPALGVDLPDRDAAAPMIHTPEQVRAVLNSALEADATACRCLAVRYFAGLRTSEAVNLAESCIRPARGHIEVTAARAKTRQRRLVTIQPALAGWLEATSARGAVLPLAQSNNRLAWAVARAGVCWAKSVTRHTFVSYHLARWQNAGKTALEAGHSETVLFRNYREVVTLADSERFWSILPEPTL